MAKEAQAYPKGKKPGNTLSKGVTSDDATFMKRGGKVPSRGPSKFEKADKKADKKAGIKENSARDKKMDRKGR